MVFTGHFLLGDNLCVCLAHEADVLFYSSATGQMNTL